MSENGADEAKAARIHKYKEERRKQLTARAAVALSTNVTKRRSSKKLPDRPISIDSSQLMSFSDINLAPSSLNIRTTKTSRLRAAASADLPNTAKTASTLSLDEDNAKHKRKTIENRDKLRRDKKISPKKESDRKKNTVGGDNILKVEVKRVERFSELEKTLTSPGEAERLFEDLVGEDNSGDHLDFTRLTETPRSVAPPPQGEIRRLQRDRHVTPAASAAPGAVHRRRDHTGNGETHGTTSQAATSTNGTSSKINNRRSFESTAAKTETLLPSSRISPKSSVPTKKESSTRESKLPSNSSRSTSGAVKTYHRRESSSKPSLIPLARRSTEASEAKIYHSPPKSESSKEAISRLPENIFKKEHSIEANSTRYNENSLKVESDPVINNRLDKTKRFLSTSNEAPNDKYHYSKKRLTNLNTSKDINATKEAQPKELLNGIMKPDSETKHSDDDNKFNTKTMSTVHETVYHSGITPHINDSRLSQRLDSLEALTKQTLDRVNKLSNNDAPQSKCNGAINFDATEEEFDSLFSSTSNGTSNGTLFGFNNATDKPAISRGVTERLRDIDTAAQRLIDFEKQNGLHSYCDLKSDISQDRRNESPVLSVLQSHTPVSILKRKSIQEDHGSTQSTNAIFSPPVTFSPSVMDFSRSDSRQKQGILKKRRSLDESQVSRQRSSSPEVSFADDGTQDFNRSILKNRRSSLEDILRNSSPDGQIQGILKRKMSKEEDHLVEDISLGSPEPQGILKRKSNSSSSSSTTSFHVSIAQAVILAAAGGAELVDDDKDAVRPILKKKSFSEERPCPEMLSWDGPKPILKKKSHHEIEDHDFDRPKKPILKTSKKLSCEENTSSFDLSEDDRSSRRPSLLKSRTSDYSGSECETTVKPILKQRCSSLTRERSQSPRPRLSFCADNDSRVTDFITDTDSVPAASSHPHCSSNLDNPYPSSVLRRRNQRPRSGNRSKSLVCEVNAELLSILNSRRLKVDKNCDSAEPIPSTSNYEREQASDESPDEPPKSFPSIAARIKKMERQFGSKETSGINENPTRSKRDRDRYKTQPITLEEMQCASLSLEPGQLSFKPLEPVGVRSFASGVAGEAARAPRFFDDRGIGASGYCFDFYPSRDPSAGVSLDSYQDHYLQSEYAAINDKGDVDSPKDKRLLEELQSEVDRVLVALDADCRALEEDERAQAEADTWSLNVSCDSGVYNRASSRDSGPHSGEDLGLIENHEAKDHRSSASDWSDPAERMEPSRDSQVADEDEDEHCLFKPGLIKSNSVVARASMWQALQQQAKGVARPLIRHNRSKTNELPIADRFTAPSVPWRDPAHRSAEAKQALVQSKSSGSLNRSLDRDDEAKLDEDDPAKMSLGEKMKMFNTRLNYKPPVPAGETRVARREDRMPRSKRLKTMPVLASQVPPPPDESERLCKSFTMEEVPRDTDFQRKMALFRSASLRNTSLKYVMEQSEKNKSIDTECKEGRGESEASAERSERAAPQVRGILKTSISPVPHKPIGKGESTEGLEDEGINSSSDDESASSSTVSSSEKNLSSSSSDEPPPPKAKRSPPRYIKNKLKASRTDSDLAKVLKDPYPTKIKLPCLNEMKDRLNRVGGVVNTDDEHDRKVQTAVEREDLSNSLAKLSRQSKEKENLENEDMKINMQKKRLIKEPIQIGKLRRTDDRQAGMTRSLDQSSPPKMANEIKKILCEQDKSLDEITAAVRKYIPQVMKSSSLAALNARLVSELQEAGAGSGSDGESSGGREVRRINTRRQLRGCGGAGGALAGCGVQRSATHADMPHRGGTTIADRLAALQAAGANDWRARVCRLSPEQDDTKAIERVKNKINDTLNQAADENKKIQIDDNELGANILADRRNKLETAAQGWRKRVPQTDAALFSVAGRLERDKRTPGTPPLTSPAVPASPGVPQLNIFRSRKQPSPPDGVACGPLRSASCAAVGALAHTEPPGAPSAAAHNKDSFKRSQSVTENISASDDEKSVPTGRGAAGAGASVAVPRADDETFTSFFKPASHAVVSAELLVSDNNNIIDADLDAVDKSRELLVSNGNRRARLMNRRAASRNPLRALAARSDLREEYTQQPPTGVADRERRRVNLEKVASGCGLAAEALAALAAKEDFSSVALRSGNAMQQDANKAQKLMLLQVKGRRRVQTRLIEPVHTNVNRGDCFVLVTPDQVFLYMGYYANVIERSRGSDIALHIHNHKDLGCKNSTRVTTIDEHAKNFSNKHWNQFWGFLGAPIDKGEYKPIEAGHPDEDEIFESTIIQTNMCYELMDDELVPIKEFWGQVPKISMLSPSKVIVFDFGSEMYIWNGKNVPLDKRRLAAQLAQELFDEGYNYEDCHVNPLTSASYQGVRQESLTPVKNSKVRPEWAVLTKVTQHMENILFREKFLDWPDFTRVIKVKNQENKTNNSEITPCDAEEMLARPYEEPDLILEGSHVGRGTHYYDKETMRHFEIKTKSVTKWIVQEYDYQKIENEAEIPEFYSADSYIIRWEYQMTVSGRELNGKPSKHNLTGRDRCAYFCWQGKDASSNEKGTAALLTVELDKEKGPQVRVTQGNESPAFLSLFQGKLVIHQGKRDADNSRFRLYVARGNVANEAYLLQVPCSMRQLRSRASLIIADTETGVLYVWHGGRALKHIKQVAVELANRLISRDSSVIYAKTIEEVKEGEEPKAVLEGLGGANRQFYNCLESSAEVADVTPRLFHFTDLGGQFEANEVLSPLRHPDLVTPFPFEQKELYSASQPALFMLDDGSVVWFWQGWWPDTEDETEAADRKAGVGAFAARWQALRSAGLATCAAYCAARGRGGGGGKPADVRLVVAGLEPLTFTNLFHCWQDEDDVAQINIQYGYKAGETLSGLRELSRLNSSNEVVLPLAALQQRPLPEDVDPEHLEKHLSNVDFQEAFGLTKEEFSELPSWKQANLKKDLGLF